MNKKKIGCIQHDCAECASLRSGEAELMVCGDELLVVLPVKHPRLPGRLTLPVKDGGAIVAQLKTFYEKL